MSASKDLLNGVFTIGTGAYLVGVAYNGNLSKLIDTLKEEEGYLDFVVALFLLGAIQNYEPTNKLSNILLFMAGFGLFIRLNNNFSLSGALKDFANGRASLIDTVKKIGGVE